MVTDLDNEIAFCIEENAHVANKKERLTLKEILGYEPWKRLKTREDKMEVGLRFWQTCRRHGFTPTDDEEHKARIYHNNNYEDEGDA